MTQRGIRELAIFLCGAWFLTSCHPNPGIITGLEHPKTSYDRQYEAVQQSQKTLASLGTPDAMATIAAKDMSLHLRRELKRNYPQIKSITVQGKEQEIVTDVCVDGDFPDAKAAIKGCATIHAAVSSSGNRLFIQPSFSRFDLQGVKLHSGVNLQAATPFVTAAVKLLITQINGVLEAQPFILNVNAIKNIDPQELKKKDPQITSVVGAPVPLNFAMGNTAVLIDDMGVHVLGDLVVLTPVRIQQTLASLRGIETNITTTALTSNQVALLSECNTFPADGSTDYADFHRICDAYAKRKEQPGPQDGHIKPDELRAVFSDLQKAFRKAAGSLQSQPSLPWDTTAVAVSKQFFSSGINEFSDGLLYGVHRDFEKHYEHFNEELRTDKFNGLPCDIDYPCDQNRSCDQNDSCEGRGCPSDCKWWDAPCHAWKPACEALKATERGACEADKTRRRAQCEAEKVAARVACEAKKATDKLGCETNKEWLKLVSETNIGRLEGTVQIESGSVDLGLQKFALGPNLSSVSGEISLGGQANLLTDLNFTPWDLAHLVCPARWNARIQANVAVESTTLNIVAPVEASSDIDGSLILNFKPNNQTLWLKFNKPPLAELFAQNPTVAISCGPAAAIGVTTTTISKVAYDIKPGEGSEEPISLFKNRFKYEVKDRILPIRIEPLDIMVGREADPDRVKITITPSWSDKTIIFTAKTN